MRPGIVSMDWWFWGGGVGVLVCCIPGYVAELLIFVVFRSWVVGFLV